MDTVYADHTISISEFKTSPAKKVGEAGGRPIAVLVNNRPEFYAVPSELFEKIAKMASKVIGRHRQAVEESLSADKKISSRDLSAPHPYHDLPAPLHHTANLVRPAPHHNLISSSSSLSKVLRKNRVTE